MTSRPDGKSTTDENWFRTPQPTASSAWTAWLGMALGIVAGLAVGIARSPIAGLAIMTIALGIGLAGATSPQRRRILNDVLGSFGRGVGRLVALLMLTPLFFVGFTAARVGSRLFRIDPLQLHNRDRRSYWTPCDVPLRKNRYVRSMFVTEPRPPGGRLSIVSLTSCGIALLIFGEIMLRLLGYGYAVLYTADDMAGYFPAANQDVSRFGGRVVTNSLGMRAPDYTRQKPTGVFRILLLGDSTLYGGQYVGQNQLYARLLEQRLAKLNPSRKVQVMNMGVNGWGPFNKLGYVEKFGVFDADLSVICLPVSDFRRPKVHIWDTPYFRDAAPPRLAYEEVLYHLNWRLRSRSLRISSADRARQVELGMLAYRDLVERLRLAGCEVLVEVLPSRTAGTTNSVPPKEQQLWSRFRAELSKVGVEGCYPAGLFVDRGAVDELYHDALHLDVLGHEIYAGHLVESVLRSTAWSQDREPVGSPPALSEVAP